MSDRSHQSTPRQEEELTQKLESAEVQPTMDEASVDSQTQASSESSNSGNSMEEYYQLQRTLLVLTIALMVLVFLPVWYFYSLNTALNYLLGALVGVLYLGLLARDVERLGQQEQRIGSKGLAIFAVTIIIASKWQELHILPIFLGFITYKAAILCYTLQITLTPAKKVNSDG